MNKEQNLITSQLRQQWDGFARENAFHYIASLKDDWNEDDFLLSGEADVARLVDPFFADGSVVTKAKTMLEIGCGVGRMSFAFARRFAAVEATDISGEMIERANAMKSRLGVTNVRFRVSNGRDLSQYASSSVDFCFSYIVMQHIPDISIILNYLREVGRVVRPGGVFRIQVNGYWRIKFPRGNYLMWGTCATHRLRRLGIGTRPHIRFGKLDPFGGVPLTVSEVKVACASAGLICSEVTGIGTQFMWVNGRKGVDS